MMILIFLLARFACVPAVDLAGKRAWHPRLNGLAPRTFHACAWVLVARPAGWILRVCLAEFLARRNEDLSEILDRAADAALEFVMNGLDKAMNKFNGSIELA